MLVLYTNDEYFKIPNISMFCYSIKFEKLHSKL